MRVKHPLRIMDSSQLMRAKKKRRRERPEMPKTPKTPKTPGTLETAKNRKMAKSGSSPKTSPRIWQKRAESQVEERMASMTRNRAQLPGRAQ